MSGFGFTPNEGFFGSQFSGFQSAPGTPMLQTQILRESARKFLSTHSDLPVGKSDALKIQEAVDIANNWIQERTTFPMSVANADITWTRKEWLEFCIPGWQKLVEPLAEGMAGALAKVMTDMTGAGADENGNIGLPEGLEGMPGVPAGMTFNVNAFLPMMRGFMGQLIANQLGQSIGALAVGVTGSHDVAVPLFEKSGIHMIPTNITAWAEGVDIPEQEVAIYLALREIAAERLFSHTPWLPNYLQDLITAYGKGITVDVQAIQDQAQSAMDSGELDISNPQSISLAINQGMFQPEQSPAQSAALERLEMALALIEGWIDHITAISAQDRLPSFPQLSETHRRKRISASPTQQLFATLLGLEVSPRKMRECANFWNEIYSLGGAVEGGSEIRDHRWEDATLLPTSADLADPAAFLASTTVPDDLSGLI